MPTDLRPLRTGELLDQTFSMYRQHFLLFAGIASMPMLMGFALRLALLPLRFSLATALESRVRLTANLFNVVNFAVLIPMVIGVSAWAVARLQLGETVSIRSAYDANGGRVVRLLGASLLAFLAPAAAVLLGGDFVALLPAAKVQDPLAALPLILLILLLVLGIAVVGLWVALGLALTQPALMIEDLGVMRSLRRSWQLAAGARRRIFVVYLLYGLVSVVVQGVLTLPFAIPMLMSLEHGAVPLWLGIVSSAMGVISSVLLLPVLCIGLALAYINQRVVKEAFDLQVILSGLGGGPDGTGAFPAATPSGE